MNIMKKYIQPSAEIVNIYTEGMMAFSISDKQPTKDNGGNQFSNTREYEDWDDEF